MSEPLIPREILEAARRRLSRRLAACVALAMAEEDFNKAQIAARLGVSEAHVIAWIDELLEGTADSFGPIGGMLAAMGRELNFRPIPLRETSVSEPVNGGQGEEHKGVPQ